MTPIENKPAPKLKITGIDKVANYNGGPCSVIFEIVDAEGGVYEAQVEMLNGFNREEMVKATSTLFALCDAIPTEVCIKAFKQNN